VFVRFLARKAWRQAMLLCEIEDRRETCHWLAIRVAFSVRTSFGASPRTMAWFSSRG
jgi:hypothetical protein